MSAAVPSRVGFLGLGVMGQPMALNLRRAGVELVVWNRTPGRVAPLAAAGARPAATPAEVFAAAETVLVMLYDEAAVDTVLDRHGPGLASMVRDRTVVVMGTHEPSYSVGLETAVTAAGGRYVEAPVSGSKGPAETGELVVMLAGADETVLAGLQQVLEPLARRTVTCGAVPAALTTKIAVNTFMITMVSGLVEAVHLADRCGLDRRVLADVLLGGPLASALLAAKLDKLLADDFTVQAAIADVAKNTGLITATAHRVGASVPLARTCDRHFRDAVDAGDGDLDLVAVLRTLEAQAGNPVS